MTGGNELIQSPRHPHQRRYFKPERRDFPFYFLAVMLQLALGEALDILTNRRILPDQFKDNVATLQFHPVY